MYIREKLKIRKHRFGRDSFTIPIVYTPSDIKRFLQGYLKELQTYSMENKFRDKEMIEVFATRLFYAVPYKHALDVAEWAFDLSLRKSFITSNRWEKGEPTIYFIDPDILNLKPGPKGPNKPKEE